MSEFLFIDTYVIHILIIYKNNNLNIINWLLLNNYIYSNIIIKFKINYESMFNYIQIVDSKNNVLL